MAQEAKPKGKIVDAVAEANILSDNVRKVTKNQIETWPSRWSWLVDENTKMYEAMAGKRPFSPYDQTRWLLPPNPLPRIPDHVLGRDGKKGKPPLPIFLPPIPDIPAQPNIPTTSNGWYGFKPTIQGRSIVSERQKWCKVTAGQHNLPCLFGWPEVSD
ncbi:uncharacterized protein [Littorina saxatilis]|uniref:Uncharacterized protein n=1 Tax=Littorina saxatilis TaxID=31220 RepID=A0AAN9AQC3_9CAEN